MRLSLLSGAFSFLQRQTVVVASRHIEFDLRNALYDQLQRLSQGFYHTYSTGDVMARATSDIESVRRYIGPAIMYIVRAGVVIVTAMTVMFIISPTLTLYALIPMPFLAVAVFFMASMQHRRSDALQAQYSRLTSRVQEALAGIRVLKAYTREDSEAEAFEEESAAYRQRNLDLAVVDAGFRPVFLLLVGMAGIIVIWLGGRLVAEGSITIGNIAEYMIYVAYMTWPVASMGFVVTMIQRASASMIRLNRIFDTEPDIADTEEMVASVREIRGSIRFDNVSFRYGEEGPWVLRDVSFDVPAGTTLAVVGRTGSGKTTLIEMIPRLLEATRGTVRIDDRPIRHIPLDVVRSSIGYVPQDVFLFSDTVGNNIAFGAQGAGEERIEEAAREAALLENVRDFPEGFETLVGERGITLSGGQKQRASIARALIRRPAILILDDALSAVDTNTESELLGHLRRYYGSCTVVIVSHRISSVMDADLILVLEERDYFRTGIARGTAAPRRVVCGPLPEAVAGAGNRGIVGGGAALSNPRNRPRDVSGQFFHPVPEFAEFGHNRRDMVVAARLDREFDPHLPHGDIPEGACMFDVEHIRALDRDERRHFVQVAGAVANDDRETREPAIGPQRAVDDPRHEVHVDVAAGEDADGDVGRAEVDLSLEDGGHGHRATALHDELFGFEEEEDRARDLFLVDEDDIVHERRQVREGEVADSLHGDAVRECVGVLEVYRLSGGQRLPGPRRGRGLHADHTHIRGAAPSPRSRCRRSSRPLRWGR